MTISVDKLRALWPQLKPSAQKALTHAVTLLADKHSGVIELQCLGGGVRNLHVGWLKTEDFRPGEESE